MDDSTTNGTGNGHGPRPDESEPDSEVLVPTGNGASAPEPEAEETEPVFPEPEVNGAREPEPGPVEPGEEPAVEAPAEPEAVSEPEPEAEPAPQTTEVPEPEPEQEEGQKITLEELLAAVQSDGGPMAEPAEELAESPSASEAPVSIAETPSVATDVAPAASAVAVEAPPEAGEEEPPSEEEALPEWVPGDWFVVHTYSGYENKVKTSLEMRVHSMNMEEKIFEIVVPMEDVMEVKSGKKQLVQRKVFPGYLLVRMDLDDDSWYVVRNTPGVTGFVGSGTKPIPLSQKEVDQILQRKGVEEKPKPKLEFSVADAVRVVVGPFANFQGVISEIDTDRSKLKVLVNIFGRETPVELGFDQVSKI